MRKGLEFAPQQVPGTQSQLGGLVGLVGGRWKIRWKMPELGLNSRTSGPDPRTQLLNQHSHTHTHIHTHTHTEDLWKANEVITYAE